MPISSPSKKPTMVPLDLSGQDMRGLETLYKATGSKRVAREIRRRLSRLGTLMRDDKGHLIR